MSKKCIGCGITLQIEEKEKKGYTKSLDMDYCMRCFRWKHYRDYTKGKENINSVELLSKLNKQKGLVFFFVDFLNLHEESIQAFLNIKLPKVFVISKLDTIPKSIYLEKIRVWLKDTWNIKEDILFIQQNSKTSIKKIEECILKYSYKTIYFAGMTNAGKSTFLNSFFEMEDLTISEMPNTTLDFLKLTMGEYTIYDTPGIPYRHYEDAGNILKNANVLKEIKPINYPLKKYASLILEDRIRIAFDEENNVTFFGSDKLNILKVYSKNTRLLEKEKVVCKVEKNSNLYIKGVGFFYIKKPDFVTIYGVEKDSISVVSSFLGE